MTRTRDLEDLVSSLSQPSFSSFSLSTLSASQHSLSSFPYFRSEVLNPNCFFIGLCGVHYVDIDIGQSQHYRRACYDGWAGCPPVQPGVRDDRVWTHLDTVIANFNSAIEALSNPQSNL